MIAVRDVIGMHADIFSISDEEAQKRCLRIGALESALFRAYSYATYDNAGYVEQAATIAHGIINSHPFIDGNKRTALISLLFFLQMHGYTVNLSQEDLASSMINLAGGQDLKDFQQYLKGHTTNGNNGYRFPNLV